MKAIDISNSTSAAGDENARPKETDLYEVLMRLHGAPPAFEDESTAPELDLHVLELLVRGALPEDKARLVYRLIFSFKSWYDAHTAMVIEQARKRPK